MREILFRGKTLGSNMWIYGDLRQYPSGAKAIKSAELIHAIEVDPATVGQYTGLKNRNGKRIFEGDIVQRGREIATVEYDEFNCSCCNGVYGWTFNGGDIREGDEYEIVGNIHDNPELMKGEHDPRNCEYFIPDKFGGWGGCLGTKEIDPCEGAKCKCWKQKEACKDENT